MAASLVNPENGYSELRLAHYASGAAGDWDRLPEWNPPAEPIAASELDTPGGASPDRLSSQAAPLALPPSVRSADDPALVALGQAAFERYPAQLAQYLSVALTSRAAAARYGLWLDETRGVGGLVRARMADGSGALALTCSSCHAAAGARRDVAGRSQRQPRSRRGGSGGAGDPRVGIAGPARRLGARPRRRDDRGGTEPAAFPTCGRFAG